VRAVETPRQPLKVIVDRHGQLAADARVLESGPVLVFSAEPPRVTWPNHVESIVLRGADGRVDLERMLALLAEREINEVHAEGGAKLNGALLAAGLVDELLLYIAPSLLGDPARGMFEGSTPLARLADRTPLDITSIERVGEDWRVLARVRREVR
jgi:diaminohydroxyphosphoribosylaminopyrimidine deaminase/5-amino-6-(5-phosphoribosylamino)uracil reductase